MACARTTSSGHGNIHFIQKGWYKVENGGSSPFSYSPWCTFAFTESCLPWIPHLLRIHCDGKGLSPTFRWRRVFFLVFLVSPLVGMLGIIDSGWWGASCLRRLVPSPLVEITMAGSLCSSGFWRVLFLISPQAELTPSSPGRISEDFLDFDELFSFPVSFGGRGIMTLLFYS